MTLFATHAVTGQPVQEGDTITDFRGDKATLVKCSRPASPGRSGKVVVRWHAMKGVKGQGHSYFDDGRETTYEYYDKVFDLEVWELKSQSNEKPSPATQFENQASAEPFMRLT